MQVISGPATTSATPSFVFQPVQLYDYQPLPSQSQCIRLLKLDPDKKHSNGALSGKLEVVDLQSSPRFSALSYVWGEPSNPSPTISCHGCHIDITPNCHDALMALRKLARGVPVWVDAICINQRDTSEKETQIQLMGEIYTCAKTVYIWLGRDDQSGSARKAIACLKLASQLCLCPVGLPWHGDFGWKSVLKDRIKLFVGAYSLRLAICCGRFSLYVS
ncbi:hypothetical protein MMC10_008593 [Thelotrema lepadinum]|nr:hypothetical protein [Thelotrema lepadinum]